MKTPEEILLEETSESAMDYIDKRPHLEEWIIDAMKAYNQQYINDPQGNSEELHRLLDDLHTAIAKTDISEYDELSERLVEAKMRLLHSISPPLTDKEIEKEARKICVFTYSNGRASMIDEPGVEGFIKGYKRAIKDHSTPKTPDEYLNEEKQREEYQSGFVDGVKHERTQAPKTAESEEGIKTIWVIETNGPIDGKPHYWTGAKSLEFGEIVKFWTDNIHEALQMSKATAQSFIDIKGINGHVSEHQIG